MKLRIGDRVKLLDDSCRCMACDVAREKFYSIDLISKYGEITLSCGLAFPEEFEWEVEPVSLENE